MAKIYKIGQYKVKSDDIFFFDCNVWVFLFASIAGSNKRKQEVYSKLLKEINTAKATIFTSSLVISEFVNVCLRLEFNLWKDQHGNISNLNFKKDFRPTSEFQDAYAATKEQVSNILSLSERWPDDFNSIDISKILNSPTTDFNDAYYMHLCTRKPMNKAKIVTDDHDIINNKAIGDIEIITM